jgi:uncharacterized membrane protein
MLSLYTFLLAVHIIAAVIWVGGALSIQVLGTRISRTDDAVRMAAFARDAEWVGTRIFAPTSGILLLAGIFLVTEGGWGFESLWIIFGILAFLYSFISGAFFIGPASKKLAEALDQRGPEDAGVQANIQRILMISRIELVILFLIVIDMAIKPGA